MGKTIKLMDNAPYDVYVLPEAREKMEIYCDLCDKEIGWLGFVQKVEKVGYLITDVVLLKQEVHATTTEINPDSMLELWGTLTPEQQSSLKMWGHSHVNMAPTPSGQDDAQMDYFKDGNDWFIRLITNKKGVMNITIYDYKAGIEIHDDRLITYNPDGLKLREAIKAEIAEKVTEKKVELPKTYYGGSTYSNVYSHSGYGANSKTTKDAKTVEPLFSDIEVKYVDSFDDAIDDPNYWQDVLTV